MTLFEISITNHSGFPFYQWENPKKPRKTVNVVKYTRYPIFDEAKQNRRFELECGYTAAMSLAMRSLGAHIASIKRTPISAEQLSEAGNELDIIFEVTVDTYMNEKNLYDRMYRAVDNIIFLAFSL